jgi:hypothetical protein
MRLRAIVIGSGWGRNAARTFGTDDRVTIVGIVGRGSERTQALANDLGVPVFPSIEDALAAVSPHIAVLAVDEQHNERYARLLVAAGCHVLCAHPVASSARAVRELAALARTHQVVATDYSLRACAEHRAAMEALANSGALLRVGIEFPGRGLPMAVDLATSFAGPAARVFATRAYPEALSGRVKSTPEAFAPTVVIEHESGTVSQLLPIPHARANEAYRALLSTEAARIDVRLPAGGATRLVSLGEGRTRESSLVSPTMTTDPTAGYRDAISSIVRNFVDAVVDGSDLISPLEVEVVVRDVWAAISASLRAREPVHLSS